MNDLVPVNESTALPVPSKAEHHLLGQVADDWAAFDVWLNLLAARPVARATLETYGREKRRLQWYCTTMGAPAPRRWTYQDVTDYLAFIRKRAGAYPCPPGAKVGDADWTPFRHGAISESSVAASMRILNTLFRFWQSSGYRSTNPFSEVAKAPRNGSAGQARHAVPPDALAMVARCMEARPKLTARDHLTFWRNRFVLCLLERTGLRANEAAKANMADVHGISDPKTGRHYWALTVTHEKGGGEGVVPMDAVVMEAFRAYRVAFGLSEIPAYDEDYGLVLSPHTTVPRDQTQASATQARRRRRQGKWRSVRTRQSIWAIVNEEFTATADSLDAGSPEASILRRASTHWLRHTRGTTLLLQGNELRLVAKAMRHKDPRVTMLYTNLDFLDVVRSLDANG